tara:strand:- start:7463 stop:7735 length:273 start_codon:yes stop_codon:yes gene_type:complete
MTYGVRILKENCTPADADDVKLPYTAYLVTYKKDGETKYDLTMCQKKVDLFDHYYDTYKKDFVTFKQSRGTIRPNLWNDPSAAKKPKKKR